LDFGAWDRAEVKITGSLGDGVEKLVVEGDRQHLEVKVQYPKSSGWGGNKSGPTDLVLMVPLRAELEIESVAADVDISGVAPSKLSIESVSGNVVLAAAPREVSVESVSGDLQLTVNSAKVHAESVSGSVVLRGRMNGEVSAETVSGGIDVAVNGEQVHDLSANTVSGSASVRTALAPKGEIRLETVSGDVSVVLPKDLSAQVHGESFSGTLKAPGAKIEKPEFGPGSSFHARYGSGDGEISIETFSGSAELSLE
jgi:DUF4097 and DUF4098 domain-containing protein YvlB